MNNNNLYSNNDHDGIYQLLSYFLNYPDSDFFKNLNRFKDIINKSDYNLNESFNMFSSLLDSSSVDTVQEFYSETFELKPKCTLHVGVHIFGDDTLKRGVLMARFKEAYQDYDVKQSSELPDFLPTLLVLSTKINEIQLLHSLLEECLIFPVEKMIESFDQSQNPYVFLLVSIHNLLKADLNILENMEVKEEIC
jgi:nitrate reductase molybdenum cofactor assembly chaperone NarJ/NarW